LIPIKSDPQRADPLRSCGFDARQPALL